MAFGRKKYGSNRGWGSNSNADRQRRDREKRERDRRDRERRDREKRERDRRDRERRDREKRERDRRDRERRDKEKRERDRRDKERRDKASLQRTRMDKERRERDRKDRERKDRASLQRTRTERKNSSPLSTTNKGKNNSSSVPTKQPNKTTPVQKVIQKVRDNRTNEKKQSVLKSKDFEKDYQKKYDKALQKGDVRTAQKYERLLNERKSLTVQAESKARIAELDKKQAEQKKTLNNSQQAALKRLKEVSVSPTASEAEKRQAKIDYLNAKKQVATQQATHKVEKSNFQQQNRLESANRDLQATKNRIEDIQNRKTSFFYPPHKKAKDLAAAKFSLANDTNKQRVQSAEMKYSERTKNARIEKDVLSQNISATKTSFKEQKKSLENMKKAELAQAKSAEEKAAIKAKYKDRFNEMKDSKRRSIEQLSEKRKQANEQIKIAKQARDNEKYLAKVQYQQEKLQAQIKQMELTNQKLNKPKLFGSSNVEAIRVNEQYIEKYKNQLNLYQQEEKTFKSLIEKQSAPVSPTASTNTTSFSDTEKTLKEVEDANKQLRDEIQASKNKQQQSYEKQLKQQSEQRKEYERKVANYDNLSEQEKSKFLDERENQIKQYEQDRLARIQKYEQNNVPVPEGLRTNPYESELQSIEDERLKLEEQRYTALLNEDVPPGASVSLKNEQPPRTISNETTPFANSETLNADELSDEDRKYIMDYLSN